MLKTVILFTAFVLVLLFTGIITKNSIVRQHNDKLDDMDRQRFNFALGNDYSYKNGKVERVLSMNEEKDVSVKIWSFNVLGDISIRLFDSEGKVHLKKEGKNMDDSLSIILGKGSYLLGIKCNHAFLGSYVLGFRNIDALRSPVSMDSVSQVRKKFPERPINIYSRAD